MRIFTLLLLIFFSYCSSIKATIYTINNQNGDWQMVLMNAGVPNPLNISATDTIRLFDCNVNINGLVIENNGRIEFVDFGAGSAIIQNNSRLNSRGVSSVSFQGDNTTFDTGSILELFDDSRGDNFGTINFDGASRLKLNNQATFNNTRYNSLAEINLNTGGSSIELFNTATFNNESGRGSVNTADNARIKINDSGVFNNLEIINATGGTLIENFNSGTLNNFGEITLAGGSFIDTYGTSTTYSCTPAATYGAEVRDQSSGLATLANIPNGTLCEMAIGVPTTVWDGNCSCVEPPVENFIVTNLNDSGPGSLRNAMQMSADRPGREIITVDPGITSSPLVLTTWNDDFLFNRLPSVSDVEMIGNGLVIDANFEGRHFQMSDNTTVRGFSFINGRRLQSNGSPFATTGSLFVGGGRECFVENCYFENNQSISLGGVVRLSNATVTMQGCTFNMNVSGKGGAIYCQGNLTLLNCTFSNNSATEAMGGGALYIRDGSNVTMNGSILANSMPEGEPDLFLEDAQTLRDKNGVSSSRAISIVFENNLVERCAGDCPMFEFMEDPMLGELEFIPGQPPFFPIPPESPIFGSGVGSNSGFGIPTMGEWGLIILGFALSILGIIAIRKKQLVLE